MCLEDSSRIEPALTTIPLHSRVLKSRIVYWIWEWRTRPLVRGVVTRIVLPAIIFLTFYLMDQSVSTTTTTHSSTTPLVFLLLLGLGLGELFSLARLPHLLGMLVAGLVLKNVGGTALGVADVTRINPQISTLLRYCGDLCTEFYRNYIFHGNHIFLRQVALVVILIRAGLGLDPEALLRLKGVVLRLAFTPCLVEALTVGVSAHFILSFPWLWALLLG